ncbi:BglG family transcription antiterminator [Neobacillus sp. PS3-34]|uniref:BglG family transcription antiterminator n=1 Tax=Neobacillus sp. PS3-34 TaxID=3070678 RepID=UPI0027DEF3CC|nr:BglG family transcription antiterminator [Neobacillus sp. PS3-34]WML46700.1 BglG family transcription antiterminator [Neobacillus sp. PS3-34]
MMIEKRPALLLNYLLNMKHSTMNQVMDHTQLTKRQISYDFEKVNHWLKERSLPPIQYKGNQYILMPDDVVDYFRKQKNSNQDRDFNLTEEERLIFIYLYLFIRHEPISSVHLTQLLQVSKNTVISDVKKANEMNSALLVEIRYTRQQGYHLKGTEFDKRVLVMQHLAQLLQMPYGEKLIRYLLKEGNEHNPFESIHDTLNQIKKLFGLHFVEERLKQFAYFLTFYFYRQKEGKFVRFHSDEMELLNQDPMRKVAEKLLQLLQFKTEETELCYFTIQLLGLSLGDGAVQDGDRDLLFKLCEQLVFDFESKACIVFEKKDEVIKTLYQHLKPAYFRMKYRIPITNPLLDQIKIEHKELFMIVKEMLLPIGTLLSITIPEEEIGFITIHFGALLEKPKLAMPKKKRAVVVCPSGISSSLMVKHQLESLFSEITVEKTLSLQEFQEEGTNTYDLVFSTVAVETELPCFQVKPIMTPIEKNSLVTEVYQHLFGIQYHELSVRELLHTIEKYANIVDENGLKKALNQITFHKKVVTYRGNQPVLQELLTDETIQIVEQLSDWEEAVKVAASPLLEKGIIQASYIEAMIENVKTLGPYVVIGPEVAIPHARPENGVNQVGMSFLKLNQPVHFLNDEKYPVRLLFCIAAIDNKTHLKALSQLTRLLSEKDNIDLLKDNDSTEDISELFKQYSEVN